MRKHSFYGLSFDTVSLLGYFVIFLFIFYRLLLTPGLIIGGDWSVPASPIQVQSHFINCFYSWSSTLLGERGLCLSSLPLIIVMKISATIGIPTTWFPKILVIVLPVISSFSTYKLLKYLKIKPIISILGGLIYATSPIYFNYLAMGWIYILLFMSLLPLAALYFVRAVKENAPKFIAFLGAISIFMVQPQAVLWLPLVWICLSIFLVNNRFDLLRFTKYFFLSISTYLLVNFYWLLGMIAHPDQRVISSDIVKSTISMGIVAHFYPVNIIRLFGSLYNFQYETIIQRSGLFVLMLSFVFPFLSILSLYIKQYKKITISMWLIAITPFFLYILSSHRNLLLNIPFSNVFRDFSRFTILSTFAYSVLVSITINYIYLKKKLLLVFIIITLAISTLPWWTGEIDDWEKGIGQDIRLRTKIFSPDYFEAEQMLASYPGDVKVLYLPVGGTYDLDNDIKFHGAFKEIRDNFSSFSPIPGALDISDRSLGYAADFVKKLTANLKTKPERVTENTNIKFILIRKDTNQTDLEKIEQNLNELVDKGDMSVFYNSRSTVVFEKMDVPPHIYIENSDLVNPKIAIKKINPTKYYITVERASSPYTLVFLERYHPGWNVYYKKNSISIVGKYPQKSAGINSRHAIIHGYANSWVINPSDVDGESDYKLIINFDPQRYSYLGLITSGLITLGLFRYILSTKK